jgi:hypothetical protein
MKRYSSPRLVEIGSISTVTKGPFEGSGDADNLQTVPVGSVGFNL